MRIEFIDTASLSSCSHPTELLGLMCTIKNICCTAGLRAPMQGNSGVDMMTRPLNLQEICENTLATRKELFDLLSTPAWQLLL